MTEIPLLQGYFTVTGQSYCFNSISVKQYCFLRKEARVCVSNAFVLGDSMFKWCLCCGRWASDRGSRYANVNIMVQWKLRHASWGYCGVKWKQCCENNKKFINSLWPRDTICRHRPGSTFVQIMACYLKAPSHYLSQRWLIINEVQWYSRECNFIRDISTTNL